VADQLGVQFFTDAKAQFESAGRWRWVVVVLIAYLHVGLVLPFAADTRDKAAVERQLMDNRTAESALKPVTEAANKLADGVNKAKDQVAADLKAGLVERFQRLGQAIAKLAALDPARAEGDEGAAVFASAPQQPQMQQQAPLQDPTALPPMDPKLRRQVVEAAKTPGQVPPDLQSYIDKEVIAPPFASANDAWAKSAAAFAQGRTTIAEVIAKAKPAAPAAAPDLDRLAEALKALGEQVRTLQFKPPPGQTWWRTVRGKDDNIVAMTSGFTAQVGNVTASQTALQTLTTQIGRLVGENQEAAAKLNDTLADLDKRAAELQSQLGEIGAPLKVVSFKLSEIAPLLPLIVAAVLAAIATWTAEGLRRMTLAAALVAGKDDAAVVYAWLRAAAGGSRVQIAWVELVVAVASIAWVLAAAWTVTSLAPPVLTPPILTAIAVVGVVGARVYHWSRADEAATVGAFGTLRAAA
jgi:hypothetical protein